MRSKLLSFLLLNALLAGAACARQTGSVAPAADGSVEEHTLTVLAAASLTESFSELGALFESQNPGVKIAFSFAGSQALAQQLAQGAEADVFASANQKYMDAAAEADRVNLEEARTFVINRLVVIFPKDNPAGIRELQDLARPGILVDLAAPSVPVGQYTVSFLEKAIQQPGFDPKFKEKVLNNVVSYENNVKAVVTKVSLGEVDAGIVYVTDITAAAGDKVGRLAIPDALNTIASYPIAPVSDSKNADMARAFMALVLSPEGQQVMAKYGFIPAAYGE